MMGSGVGSMMAACTGSMWALLTFGGLIGIGMLVVLAMLVLNLRSMQRHPS